VRTDYELLNESLEMVAPVADDLIRMFYDQLFEQHPAVRAMFPADMTEQRERLLKAIVDVVTNYDRREELVPVLADLGKRHVQYGAQPEHFPIVGGILLECLAKVAGDVWNQEYEGAWARMYTFTADTMLAGAAEEVASAA
jgi:hemoglobin-like flavoprotein